VEKKLDWWKVWATVLLIILTAAFVGSAYYSAEKDKEEAKKRFDDAGRGR
jgi:hypothetical protein